MDLALQLLVLDPLKPLETAAFRLLDIPSSHFVLGVLEQLNSGHRLYEQAHTDRK